jgi:protein-S-isoprenylcysteine O-methyltransferase Ste14
VWWNAVGALTIVVLIAMVLTRVAILRREGIAAMKFGAIDKSDFLIPPFALFYLYLVLAAALHWPTVIHNVLFVSPALAWLGVALCAAGIALMLVTLASFGTSFRVGIDVDEPDALVTSGIFAFTRNPIYVAFGIVLLGELLILPHWILLVYLVAGIALFHRQVLREEQYLASRYGEAYRSYCERVPRYF